jgi:hypothetical protein
MTGRAEMIAGLNAAGELWKADTANFNGTKQKLATLTAGGASYIDSAYDGQYLYGLRDDGAVYQSDAQGNVSQVGVSGWSGVIAISAQQGTLYGMTGSGTIRATNGTASVTLTGSMPWVDFSITDNGNFWMVTGGSSNKSYCYAFTNGYSGAVAGNAGFITQGNASGIELATAGNDLYVLRVYLADSAVYKNSTFITQTGVMPADLAAGNALYYIETTGKLWTMPFTNTIRTVVGTFTGAGSSFVGVEALPAPRRLGLFMLSSVR